MYITSIHKSQISYHGFQQCSPSPVSCECNMLHWQPFQIYGFLQWTTNQTCMWYTCVPWYKKLKIAIWRTIYSTYSFDIHNTHLIASTCWEAPLMSLGNDCYHIPHSVFTSLWQVDHVWVNTNFKPWQHTLTIVSCPLFCQMVQPRKIGCWGMQEKSDVTGEPICERQV